MIQNYDPDWTAIQASEATEPTKDWNDPTQPFYRWAAHHDLAERCKLFESGDVFQLMHAIRICANHDMPLPEWVSRAYISAYDRVVSAQAKTWGDVFGQPYPKGIHLNAVKKRRNLIPAVWVAVRSILDMEPGTPIDGMLFERVGKKLNIGKSQAAEFYYEAKRRYGVTSTNS